MMHKRLIAIALSLVVLGQGCVPAAPATPSEPSAPAKPSEPAMPSDGMEAPETPDTPMEPPATGADGYQIPPKDESWQTYTNKALDFSFQYPTRGRYAPTWDVRIYSLDDAHIRDNCYLWAEDPVDPSSKTDVVFGGRRFCRTLAVDAAAGSRYHTLYYATEVDRSWVVVAITLRAVVGDNYDNPSCHGHLVFPYPSCPEFNITLFKQQADTIISTFQANN